MDLDLLDGGGVDYGQYNFKRHNEDLERHLVQLQYDCEEYVRNLHSIEETKNKLDQYKGKPFYDGCLEAIRRWEHRNEEIKKTMFPAMDFIKNNLK